MDDKNNIFLSKKKRPGLNGYILHKTRIKKDNRLINYHHSFVQWQIRFEGSNLNDDKE